MVIKTTRWSPDTCECIIEYTWDTESAPETRTHTFSRLVKPCPNHISLPTELSVYETVKEENTRKNKVLKNVLNSKDAPVELYDIQGKERILKHNINFKWTWVNSSTNRILNAEFERDDGTKINITAQTKTKLESSIITEFGSGKVVLL